MMNLKRYFPPFGKEVKTASQFASRVIKEWKIFFVKFYCSKNKEGFLRECQAKEHVLREYNTSKSSLNHTELILINLIIKND
jgi:hypothetical protein